MRGRGSGLSSPRDEHRFGNGVVQRPVIRDGYGRARAERKNRDEAEGDSRVPWSSSTVRKRMGSLESDGRTRHNTALVRGLLRGEGWPGPSATRIDGHAWEGNLMRGDFQRYKRAAGLSILGMVLQLALAAALVVYGLMSVRDTTASWAAAFAVSGAVVWLILAIVYDQHRRERLEALEAETVAGERGGTSVFESRGEEFKVAGKRLAGMYRWLLPVVAIALAGFLIGVGALTPRENCAL